MKSIVRSIASFITALCLASSASAIGAAQSAEAPDALVATETQVVVVRGKKLTASAVANLAALPPVATTENFPLGEWKSLWVYFIAQKLPRHEWPKYWKDACVLSQIACTEVAWKHLPIQVVVTVPRNQSAILADEAHRDLVQFAAVRAALKAELAEMSRSNVSMKEEMLRSKINFSLMSIVALSMFALCAFLLLRWRLAERRLRKTCGHECSGPRAVSTTDTKPKSSLGCACGHALSDPEERAEMNAGEKCATPCGSGNKSGCCAEAVVPSSEKSAVLPDVDPTLFDAWSPRTATVPIAKTPGPCSSEPLLMKIFSFSPEVELGYADAQDGSGLRYAFSQKTEGYSADFDVGQTFKGIVNSTGCVVKILTATPT